MASSNNTLPPLLTFPAFPSSLLLHKYAVYYHLEVNKLLVTYKLLGVDPTLPAANKRVREALAHHKYREWHETEDDEGLISIKALTMADEMVRIQIDQVPHNWERCTQTCGEEK